MPYFAKLPNSNESMKPIQYTSPCLQLLNALLWTTAFSLVCLSSVFAQYQTLRFERLTIEDGLPNPSVLDIIQDQQGFMWFGTLSGVVRYDGYEMKVYRPAAFEQDSLPRRNVPKLYMDKSGNIWLGFAFSALWPKLFRYDPALDRFVPYLFDPKKKENPISRGISSIREDRLGRLLVGTWGDGLYAIDLQKEKTGIAPKDLPFRHLLHDLSKGISLPENNAIARDWAEDGEGNLWLPTDDGLCKFTPGEDRFQTFRFSKDTIPLANEFGALFLEKTNTLWIGSVLHGLLTFDIENDQWGKTFQHDPANPFSIADSPVHKIIKAQDGRFWLGMDDALDIYDPGTGRFTHIKDEKHKTWKGVFPHGNALIEDQTGNIWIATWQSGIYKFNPDKDRFHFLKPDGKKLPGVDQFQAECEDDQGFIWLSTEGNGLIRWNRINNSFRQYLNQPGHPNSLSSNNIGNVSQDARGNIWIGTDTALDRMDANGNFRHYHPFPEGYFTKVFITRNQSVWVSGFQSEPGLCVLTDVEKGTFRCYSNQMENLGGVSGLVTFEEDYENRLWLGVNQWGFYRHDPETGSFEHLAKEFGVHDILFDQYGNTWLTTHSAGLKLWDQANQQVVHLTKAQHDQIGITRKILEDGKGFLWLKTPEGIVQFDPRSRKVVRHFNVSNWMPPNQEWYGGGTLKTSKGEFFINSPGGILYFYPDSVRYDSTPPKVVLTEFRISNEIVQPGEGSPLAYHITFTDSINLAHTQNDISLQFAALHFKTPEENRIRFMLENHDQEWRQAGSDRTASYTNLSPGTYHFKVIAANSDGIETGEIKLLTIVIRKPWYMMPWAMAIFIAASLLALFYLRRYELRRQLAKSENKRLHELDEVKTRLYTNITHEFRTPLTLILGVAGQLKAQASEGMKPGLDTIRRHGNKLLDLVNQMLDLAKLESGEMKLHLVQGDVAGFLKYLSESFHSLAKQKNIHLSFESQPDEIMMDYDPERLRQVLVNLLSNAIKFTPEGGKVVMSLTGSEKLLTLGVRDSGAGIRPEDIPYIFDRFYQADASHTRKGEGTGIGLALTREMVNLMGGTISVESEWAKGSVFTVTLPVNRTARIAEAKAAPVSDLAITEVPFENTPDNPETDHHKPLLLLVEDNADVLRYIASCLKGTCQLAFATDGQQGIDKAMELIPDLIISDVMMPVKDGFELCNTLKHDEKTSHIPIILLTAKADVESRIAGLGRGADAYLSKPFHERELLIRVKSLLELRARLQQFYSGFAGLAPAQPSDENLPTDDAERIFLVKAREVVIAHLTVPDFKVTEFARELNMSKTQLYRKMTAVTGQSAHQFILHIQLDHAKKLLLQHHLTISEIAFECGFGDPSYFSRIFKKETGMSPSDYREKGGA